MAQHGKEFGTGHLILSTHPVGSSDQSTDLTVVGSQVFDTRDANGVMPSDHRPGVTTFLAK